MYQNYNAIGTENLTPEELMDRQWGFFLDELIDDDPIKLHIGDWDGELKDEGYQVLESLGKFVEWCGECLEISESKSILLLELIKDDFEAYRGSW